MLKLSERDIDSQYTQYQLKQIVDDYDISNELKNFLCLNILLHDNKEHFSPEVKGMLNEAYLELGSKVRNEILENMERWLNSHTSGEYLFDWKNYDDDKESTWAWQLVEEGKIDSHQGLEFDFKPLAAKKLLTLARQFYGDMLTEDDVESFKYAADEMAMGNDEGWENLSEDFREFLARKYTPQAFKAWRNYWGSLLEQPTKDVSAAVKRLKKCTIQELGPAISLALNTYHVHGQMIEHTNLRQQDLDYLHDMPESEVENFKKGIFGEAYSNLTLARLNRKITLSFRDKIAKRTILGGFWISPKGQIVSVPWGENSHGDWGRKYLKRPEMSDQEVYDYFLSKNWVRVRADVIDFSEYALGTAKDFIHNNVPENERDGDIVVNIWPNGLIKYVTPNEVLNADSVYDLR